MCQGHPLKLLVRDKLFWKRSHSVNATILFVWGRSPKICDTFYCSAKSVDRVWGLLLCMGIVVLQFKACSVYSGIDKKWKIGEQRDRPTWDIRVGVSHDYFVECTVVALNRKGLAFHYLLWVVTIVGHTDRKVWEAFLVKVSHRSSDSIPISSRGQPMYGVAKSYSQKMDTTRLEETNMIYKSKKCHITLIKLEGHLYHYSNVQESVLL